MVGKCFQFKTGIATLLPISQAADIPFKKPWMGTSPSQEWLEYISSRGRGGRLEGGCLRLAEGDGVGEVLLLLQPQSPHAVVLGPPRRLGSHLQVNLKIGLN